MSDAPHVRILTLTLTLRLQSLWVMRERQDKGTLLQADAVASENWHPALSGE